MSSKRQVRAGDQLYRLLLDVKSKNRTRSLTEAGEYVAEYLNRIPKKKKLRRQIINEIQF